MKRIFSLLFIFSFICTNLSTNAQGVIVYKKDGSKFTISYHDLDSIVTFEKLSPIGAVADPIDLGLSVKWASWNIGASKAEQYGNYFAWGETEQKDNFTKSTYRNTQDNGNFIDFDSNISGTDYDVASTAWGDGWRLPSNEEFQELIDKCNWKWETRDGIKGYKITGPSGNSIFLPAAGCYHGKETTNVGIGGHYWSSTLGNLPQAWYLYYTNIGSLESIHIYDFGDCYNGHTVRAVKD